MNIFDSPEDWSPPQWHPDLGNPSVQLEHLRSFSLSLRTAVPDAVISLEIPEPGLMDVHVELPNGTSAEVHSVPCVDAPENRRLAIFFAPGTKDERELYAQTIESAVTHFLRAPARRKIEGE